MLETDSYPAYVAMFYYVLKSIPSLPHHVVPITLDEKDGSMK